ncbi:MAG: hypothetical protein WCG75_03505, partial [Armatimonadota bacterium]
MQQQGILTRIIALLALISLVLPASARATSCMIASQKMTCCMARATVAPKPKLAEPKEDCCHPKAKSATRILAIEQAKSACHCAQKSVPVAPAPASILNLGHDGVEVIVPNQERLTPSPEATQSQSTTIFFTDSSPPDDTP